ncbi:hypothetical protein ACN20G_19155 [Streptomyces sp. BI20]|uniref:hypothetical protein n=1 Tax=Streptomyces sp. BI20 TaxID=3403460 RepID=UPI003C769A71
MAAGLVTGGAGLVTGGAGLVTGGAGLVTGGAGLITGGAGDTGSVTLTLTEAGRATQDGIRERVAHVTEHLYGDLPPADRAVTARAPALVTERANTVPATIDTEAEAGAGADSVARPAGGARTADGTAGAGV